MQSKDPSYDGLLKLGEFLRESVLSLDQPATQDFGHHGNLSAVLDQVAVENPWFTRESCMHALRYWGQMLSEASLSTWLEPYESPAPSAKTIALILAGNVPLVGFHDLLSVLLTGNRALVKCASNDRILLPFLTEKLAEFEPSTGQRIVITDGRLASYDAVIATGSNNTSRYFEYYFSKKPHIIRKNRHGAAILDGNESDTDLNGLAEDVFRYFGMGCRSTSKLFVPEGYDFDGLFEAFYSFKDVIHHHKYANNYDYNKAVYLMSGSQMLDNGFLLLKEDASFGSPIGTLFYETYKSSMDLDARLKGTSDQLQCLVAGPWFKGGIPFGKAQWPELSDYADGVDTVEFLLKTSTD